MKALRGRIITREIETPVLVTMHPSAVLRALPELRESTYHDLVNDLGTAAAFIAAVKI